MILVALGPGAVRMKLLCCPMTGSWVRFLLDHFCLSWCCLPRRLLTKNLCLLLQSKTPMATACTLEGPTLSTLGGEGAGRAGLRILIVEDHVDCAESMALLLRLYGHDVESASNGSAA